MHRNISFDIHPSSKQINPGSLFSTDDRRMTDDAALDTIDEAVLEDIKAGRDALNSAEGLTEESRIEVAA